MSTSPSPYRVSARAEPAPPRETGLMRVVLVALWCVALWGLFEALDPGARPLPDGSSDQPAPSLRVPACPLRAACALPARLPMGSQGHRGR